MEKKSKCCGWIAVELIDGIYRCGNCSKGCEIVTVSDEENCRVKKETGGHYFTEGGNKMCCDEGKDMVIPGYKSEKLTFPKNPGLKAVTPPESWEEEFANKYKSLILFHFSPNGITAFNQLNDFISQTLATEKEKYKQAIKILEKEIDDMARDWDKNLSTEKAKWMKEWREKIENAPKTLFDNIDGDDTYEEGYETCLNDVLNLLTTPSEQEEK